MAKKKIQKSKTKTKKKVKCNHQIEMDWMMPDSINSFTIRLMANCKHCGEVYVHDVKLPRVRDWKKVIEGIAVKK